MLSLRELWEEARWNRSLWHEKAGLGEGTTPTAGRAGSWRWWPSISQPASVQSSEVSQRDPHELRPPPGNPGRAEALFGASKVGTFGVGWRWSFESALEEEVVRVVGSQADWASMWSPNIH